MLSMEAAGSAATFCHCQPGTSWAREGVLRYRTGELAAREAAPCSDAAVLSCNPSTPCWFQGAAAAPYDDEALPVEPSARSGCVGQRACAELRWSTPPGHCPQVWWHLNRLPALAVMAAEETPCIFPSSGKGLWCESSFATVTLRHSAGWQPTSYTLVHNTCCLEALPSAAGCLQPPAVGAHGHQTRASHPTRCLAPYTMHDAWNQGRTMRHIP